MRELKDFMRLVISLGVVMFAWMGGASLAMHHNGPPELEKRVLELHAKDNESVDNVRKRLGLVGVALIQPLSSLKNGKTSGAGGYLLGTSIR
jgi:hypothetical protein